MAKLRKRPRSVPKGNRSEWDNIATMIYHLEQRLEELAGETLRPVIERQVIIKAKDAQNADDG